MYWKHLHKLMILCCILVSICLLCSCQETQKTPSGTNQSAGSRSNTPVIYKPDTPGTETIGSSTLIIDISNKNQGYVMAKYSGTSSKANIQITGSDGITYKYFLTPSDTYVPFPLTSASGTYQLDGYENIMDNKYAIVFSESVDVQLKDEFLPFLYPNQYVSFSSDTKAVTVASDVVSKASSDLEAIEDIYHYIIEHITYDEEKAASVTSGYLPDVDETLETGKGICFDFASLTATMLRSQNIPTRLEIGYSGDIYHAWISVYTKETGWIDRIIEFTGDGWTRMDPTFASSNDNSEKILKYIGDGSNYTTQYIR